jgi:hypothetical protein
VCLHCWLGNRYMERQTCCFLSTFICYGFTEYMIYTPFWMDIYKYIYICTYKYYLCIYLCIYWFIYIYIFIIITQHV